MPEMTTSHMLQKARRLILVILGALIMLLLSRVDLRYGPLYIQSYEMFRDWRREA